MAEQSSTVVLPVGGSGKVLVAPGTGLTRADIAAIIATALGGYALVSEPIGAAAGTAAAAAQGTATSAATAAAAAQGTANAAVPKSTVTTKGDLLAATAVGALARLGVGADTRLLMADASQAAGLRWGTSQESVARALGWMVATDPQWAGGADPTGATSSSAAVNAIVAALPSTGATIYFPPGVFVLDTATGGVLVNISAKPNVTIRGAGQASVLRMQNVTATDGLRVDGCASFTMQEIAVQVTNGATITNAIQFTCPISGGAHNGAFNHVYVTNPSQSARSIFDVFTTAGSAVVTSAAAAFAAGDVGGWVGITQATEVLTAKVLSVATRTATVSNGGSALTAIQTTIPLAAPIPSAPNGPYTIVIDGERMQVSAGFQTSTLTVVRAYDQTTATTHADGSTVTTYQATLDTNALSTMTNPVAMKIQTPTSSAMINGISVGSDHASSALDIPQLKFIAVQVEGAIGCGFRLGGSVPGNILNLSHTACEVALSTVGVFMNGAVTNWHGPSMGSNGIDFKMGQPASQPVVIDGVRSELSGMLWELTGAGTSAGTNVTIRDSKILSFGAADGVPIRHLYSIPLNLDQLTLTRATAGQTILIQAQGGAANPLYYQARNVSGNWGNNTPHPASGTTIIRTIMPGPRLSTTSLLAAKANYGVIFDDIQVHAKRLNSSTLATNGAVTIDASSGDAIITLQANATSSSITNPTTGQELRITWIQDATGGRTYAWPSSCKFAGGSAPSDTTASKQSTVTFRYDGANWQEVGRAVAVG